MTCAGLGGSNMSIAREIYMDGIPSRELEAELLTRCIKRHAADATGCAAFAWSQRVKGA